MRKCHYECLYFSSYSSKAVHFHPAHMILQSVHPVIEIVWYKYLYLPPKASKFLFPGIKILISQYFPPSQGNTLIAKHWIKNEHLYVFIN